MVDNFNLPLNLRLIRNCPICQHEFKANSIQVLSENDFGALTYMICAFCGARLLTKLSSMPQGIVGNAILTDLKPEEVMDFSGNAGNIQADDVLAVHQLINDQEFLKQLNNK